MDNQGGTTMDTGETKGENSEAVLPPVSVPIAAIVEPVTNDLSKQMDQIKSTPTESSNKEMEISTQVGSLEKSETLPKELTQNDVAAQSSIIKQEPTDAEMASAEDFTRRESDFPTVPRINIQQEKLTSFTEQVAAERSMESKAVLQIANSSLSLLCQYISSDSESNITDSEDELPRKPARAAVRHDSTSSDSSDDVQIIPNTDSYRVQEVSVIVSDTEATEMDESDDTLSEDEEEAQTPRTAPPIKSRGEVLPTELPPIEDLQISVPEEQCKPIGHIESIVAQIVIVQSYAGVELLNLETVLFLEKGKRALGKIFDVIGQVTAPMYCVLFNNRQDVVRRGISIGMPVYCAPQTEHTSFIILSDLMKSRGSDASWLDDNEAPDHVLDYSDDEQERSARRRRRGSCSSSGRNSPEEGHSSHQPYHLPYQPYPQRRGHWRGGGGHRGRQGHSWHTNFPPQQPPQRFINPFAFVAGVPPPPPPPLPPPPPPGSSNN